MTNRNENRISNSRVKSSDQQLVIEYLYGCLPDKEREAIENRLNSDLEFAQIVDSHKAFDKLLPKGTQPQITNQRLEHNHWALQKKLRKQRIKSKNFGRKLIDLKEFRITLPIQVFGMLFAFFVGILVNQPQPTVNTNAATLNLVNKNDYQIVDLNLREVNPDSGAIKVNFSLAARSSVDGNLANPQIQKLLSETMINDVSDAIRLDLVMLLKDYTKSEQVKQALTHSLLNDPNPGVRIVAAESLAKLAADESMRIVLRKALQNDINSGVRVEAFEALVKHLDDEETLKTLKQFSIQDSNQYIRDQSKHLLANNSTKQI